MKRPATPRKFASVIAPLNPYLWPREKHVVNFPNSRRADTLMSLHRQPSHVRGREISNTEVNLPSTCPRLPNIEMYRPLSFLQLKKKCKDLEFEATSQARRRSLEGELEKQLREASVALALAEGRATDLANRLADRESASCTLQLRLKVKDVGENKRSIRTVKECGVVSDMRQPRVKVQVEICHALTC